mgnify:CR=1 FL=1
MRNGVASKQCVTDAVRTTTHGNFETEMPFMTIASPNRQSCRQRLRISNLRLTVPLRGHVSLCQALLVLIINLALPGLGTLLLACFASEKFYWSDSAQELAAQNNLEEIQQKIRTQIRKFRRYVVTIGFLQLLGVLCLMAGYVWALTTSIQLLRDACTYRTTKR